MESADLPGHYLLQITNLNEKVRNMSQYVNSDRKKYSPLGRAVMICAVILLSIFSWEKAREWGLLNALDQPDRRIASREEPGEPKQPATRNPYEDLSTNPKQEKLVVKTMKPVMAHKPTAKIEPNATELTVDLRVDNLLLKGKQLSAAGDYSAAIPLFSQAIQAQPDRLDGYILRANAEGKSERYEAAIADYQHAVARGRASFSIYYSLAQAYIRTKDYSRAIEFCTRAIAEDSEIANCYITRGVAYHALRDFRRAIDDYTKAIALDETSALAYRNRATAWFAIKESQRATADLEKARVLTK